MMRCMKANMRKEKIWFAKFVSSNELTEQKGEYTLYTGDRGGNYTELKSFRANIALKSYFYNGDSTSTMIFGTDIDYDRVIQVDWTNEVVWEIDEYSKLWVDVEPYIDGVLQPHDYEVVRIGNTHDSLIRTIAIKRVSRNEEGN